MRLAIILLATTATALAAPPPEPRPSPPPVVRQVVPRQPGVWERIQDPLDRSTGRIVGDSLYETERLQRLRDERLGRVVPQTEFQQFMGERERWLRIDDRATRDQLELAIRRKAESDRRVYEQLRRAGFSPTASQAMADDEALTAAQNARNEQLRQAQESRTAALKEPGADAAKIEAAHQRRVEELDRQFDFTRGRLLGYVTSPATQPAL